MYPVGCCEHSFGSGEMDKLKLHQLKWKTAWKSTDCPGIFFGCAADFGQWVQVSLFLHKSDYLIWENRLYDLDGNVVECKSDYGYVYCLDCGVFLREAKKEEREAAELLSKVNKFDLTHSFFMINTELEPEFAVGLKNQRSCFISDEYAPIMMCRGKSVSLEQLNTYVWNSEYSKARSLAVEMQARYGMFPELRKLMEEIGEATDLVF